MIRCVTPHYDSLYPGKRHIKWVWLRKKGIGTTPVPKEQGRFTGREHRPVLPDWTCSRAREPRSAGLDIVKKPFGLHARHRQIHPTLPPNQRPFGHSDKSSIFQHPIRHFVAYTLRTWKDALNGFSQPS